MMIGVRSYFTALQAGRRFKRAQALERAGRSADALTLAREGLSLLHSSPGVRPHVAEAATLGMLTMMIERLASNLGEPGVPEADLRDVLRVLEVFVDSSDSRSLTAGRGQKGGLPPL